MPGGRRASEAGDRLYEALHAKVLWVLFCQLLEVFSGGPASDAQKGGPREVLKDDFLTYETSSRLQFEPVFRTQELLDA